MKDGTTNDFKHNKSKSSKSGLKGFYSKREVEKPTHHGTGPQIIVRTEKRIAEIEELRQQLWAVCRGEEILVSGLKFGNESVSELWADYPKDKSSGSPASSSVSSTSTAASPSSEEHSSKFKFSKRHSRSGNNFGSTRKRASTDKGKASTLFHGTREESSPTRNEPSQNLSSSAHIPIQRENSSKNSNNSNLMYAIDLTASDATSVVPQKELEKTINDFRSELTSSGAMLLGLIDFIAEENPSNSKTPSNSNSQPNSIQSSNNNSHQNSPTNYSILDGESPKVRLKTSRSNTSGKLEREKDEKEPSDMVKPSRSEGNIPTSVGNSPKPWAERRKHGESRKSVKEFQHSKQTTENKNIIIPILPDTPPLPPQRVSSMLSSSDTPPKEEPSVPSSPKGESIVNIPKINISLIAPSSPKIQIQKNKNKKANINDGYVVQDFSDDEDDEPLTNPADLIPDKKPKNILSSPIAPSLSLSKKQKPKITLKKPSFQQTGYMQEDLDDDCEDMTPEEKKAYDEKLMAELLGQQSSASSSSSSSSDSSSDSSTDSFPEEMLTYKNQEDREDDILMMKLNARFQEVAIQLFSLGIYNTQATLQKLNMEFLDISRDFLTAASSVGRIIISEVYISEKKKTIKPISVGGTIGGEKYIVHSILFKHAIGSGALDDDMAAKIAGHELKGLVHVWECRTPGLHFPLQCLIDYLGFRLVAMLLLPLRKYTLKVGTNDAGKTMNYLDDELMQKMTEVGKSLNLAPHIFHSQKIYCAADLEGHVGTDGRRYLIDLSRTFPPCPPQGKTAAHLYKLFRPEFVKMYKVPLCSDGFSRFCDDEKELRYHNKELKTAYAHLFNVTMPNFAAVFDKLVDCVIKLNFVTFQNMKFNIARVCHQNGINLRFLGHFQSHCKNKNAKNILSIEMIARTIKRMVRLEWRNTMKQQKFPLETPYIDSFINFMNKFIREKASQDEVQKEALNYYEIIEGDASDIQKMVFVVEKILRSSGLHHTSEKEGKEVSPIDLAKKHGCSWGLLLLLDRVCSSLGIRIRPEYLEKWRKTPESLIIKYSHTPNMVPIPKSAIQGLDHNVKHMNVISHAEGYIIKGEKHPGASSDITSSFTSLAIEYFETALNSSSLNKVSLRNLASEYSKIWFPPHDDDRKEAPKVDPERKEAQLEYIKYLFIQALKSDPEDTHTLYQYASFFYYTQQYDLAEEWVLKSLIADKSHLVAFQLYTDILLFVAERPERSQIMKKFNDSNPAITQQKI